MAFLNGFSTVFCLICGLLAWILPFLGKNIPSKIMTSLLCCALSLCGVVLYIWTEARTGDFAAIEDTARAFTVAIIVMVIGTLISCGVNLLRNRRKKD